MVGLTLSCYPVQYVKAQIPKSSKDMAEKDSTSFASWAFRPSSLTLITFLFLTFNFYVVPKHKAASEKKLYYSLDIS